MKTYDGEADEPFKLSNRFSNATVVYNDPDCTNNLVHVCIEPEIPLQTQYLVSEVVPLFDGTPGSRGLDEDSEIKGWKTKRSCSKSEYLEDTSKDPRLWTCLRCPEGSSCDGDVVERRQEIWMVSS